MNDNNRNLILAIVASVVILIGFQYFYAPEPPPPPAEQGQQAGAPGSSAPGSNTLQPSGDGSYRADPGGPGAITPGGSKSREEVLSSTPRIAIDTPRVHGSISLLGGLIDDLTLKDYKVDLSPDSPDIILLSPPSAPDGYFAQFAWSNPQPETQPARLPDIGSRWTTDDTTLTPDSPVTLSWDNGEGLLFHMRISIDRDYLFQVDQWVEAGGSAAADGAVPALQPYGLVRRHGVPPGAELFILHEGPLGVFRDSLEKDGTLDEISYSTLEDDGTVKANSIGGWIGFTDKYWLTALIPQQDQAVSARFLHRAPNNADLYQVDVLNNGAPPAAGEIYSSRFFAGAKVVSLIDHYQDDLGIIRFDRTIDWGWFYFLTRPIFTVLDYFYGLIGNFGVAIILLTFCIKVLFLPLAYKSYVSMSAMKNLQPEMMKLREKFGDDKQALNREMMALYKKEKVNPAAGCIPILLQIPVFFALYKVLLITIEMRQAPFFWWIRDLSVPDPTTILNLFGLLPYTITLAELGPLQFLSIGVLPLIMGFTMWLQMRVNPTPPDPVQARIFMLMPIFFTFLLAHFPAGLVIYWITNNTLSIAQQVAIQRRMKARSNRPAPVAKT
ncbi:MAG: membrane protein insertase YidC [Sneathiellaceae bacterium]